MDFGGPSNPQSCPERSRMLPPRVSGPNSTWQNLSSSPRETEQSTSLDRRGYSDSTVPIPSTQSPHSPASVAHRGSFHTKYRRRTSDEGSWDTQERSGTGIRRENAGPGIDVLVDRKRRLTAPGSPGRRGSGVEGAGLRRHYSERMGERPGSSEGVRLAGTESQRISQGSRRTGSRSAPIDLTGSDGGSVPRPQYQSQDGAGSDRALVLPRWQPDSQVSHCPVCGTSFGFFFRKHHCRYV